MSAHGGEGRAWSSAKRRRHSPALPARLADPHATCHASHAASGCRAGRKRRWAMASAITRTGEIPGAMTARPDDEELDLFGITHAGKVRKDNQDHYLIGTL